EQLLLFPICIGIYHRLCGSSACPTSFVLPVKPCVHLFLPRREVWVLVVQDRRFLLYPFPNTWLLYQGIFSSERIAIDSIRSLGHSFLGLGGYYRSSDMVVHL